MVNRTPNLLRVAILLLLAILPLACTKPAKIKNAEATSAPGTSDYEGYHDFSNCDGIVGWAWDKNRPDEHIKVEIYDGDSLVDTVNADKLRRDLIEAHKGNGEHGFDYSIPARLKDGKPHSIRVKYAGTNIDLLSTPKPLNCVPQGS